MKEYFYYIQTILRLSDPEYTDNQQNDYDCYDEFQGCESWHNYQETWN